MNDASADKKTKSVVRISVPAQPGAAALDVEIKRITVLLGANGSGKSRTLKRLSADLSKSLPSLIYVEGGRAILLDEKETPRTEVVFRDDDAADKHYVQHKKTSLSKRLQAIFRVIRRKVEKDRIAHSIAVSKWQESGVGVCPTLPELPDAKLVRLFNEVFSEVRLDGSLGRFDCKRKDQAYKIKEMSDGEKQALALIADIAVLGEESSVVLVDEPELNLNALLACRLWDTIERERPDLQMIYASHLLSFAMRPGVETVVTLAGPDRNPNVIPDIGKIDPDELRPFLGSIPAILSSAKTVLVEGEPDSLDTALFRWALSQSSLAVVPFADCERIVSAVKAEGLWRGLSTNVAICGVIDRDFRSDDQIRDLMTNKIVVLDYHEIESYLCAPDLVLRLAERIGTTVVPRSAVEKVIFDSANNSLIRVVCLRAIQRLRALVSPALDAGVLKVLTSIEQAKQLLESALASQKQRIDNLPSPTEVIDQEFALCNNAIQTRDVESVLRIFEGKAIFHQIPQLLGLQGAGPYLNALRHHLKPDEIPAIVKIRQAVTPVLGA